MKTLIRDLVLGLDYPNVNIFLTILTFGLGAQSIT